MQWRNELAPRMPDPDPYGPDGRSTRRDILDELADHLECAAHHERRRATEHDETRIQSAVIDRFGDPAAIARRLWWDAMKEQIMSNRIMLGTNVALIITVVVVSFVTINSMQQNRMVTDALRIQLADMAQQRDQQSELADWSKVNVRVAPVPGGDASGFDVSLRGDAFNAGTKDTIHAITDAEGAATFGPMRPGSYTVVTKDHEGTVNQRTIVAYPGRENEIPLQWRTFDAEDGAVIPSVLLPDVFKDQVEFVRLELSSDPLTLEESEGTWRDGNNFLSIMVDRSGHAFLLEEGMGPFEGEPGGDLRLTNLRSSGAATSVKVDSAHSYRIDMITVFMARTKETWEQDGVPAYREINLFNHRQRQQQVRQRSRTSLSDLRNRRFRSHPGELATWKVELLKEDLPRFWHQTLREEGIFLPVEDEPGS